MVIVKECGDITYSAAVLVRKVYNDYQFKVSKGRVYL